MQAIALSCNFCYDKEKQSQDSAELKDSIKDIHKGLGNIKPTDEKEDTSKGIAKEV